MTKTSENLKSLSQIFTDTVRFVVPDYQRGYSWGTKQLDDLWEDLNNLSETRNHYTGMFTFCKDGSSGMYQIVDGQQRMTTLIILINELLSLIQGGIPGGSDVDTYKRKYLYKKPYGSIDLEYKFQYSVDNPSDAFFKTQILGQEETGSFSQPQNTLYTRNLRRAKDYFKEKIKDCDQVALAALFTKVTERLKFNEYLIDDPDDVYVTFETMNNRGKSLSKLELLKNRLIYLSTLYSAMAEDDPTEQGNVKKLRENINNAWKTIYEYLGKSVNKILDDDAFLKDHWIMYFRYDRSASNVFEKDLLSKNFTAKKVLAGDLPIQEVNKYVCCLQKSIIAWYNISCPDESDLKMDDRKWLVRLNRVGIGCFKPLLVAAYLRFPERPKVDLIQACERFNFLVKKITERRSNTGDSFFYTKAHDFFESNNPNEMGLIQIVNDKTKLETSFENFINNTKERYKNGEGFYSWSGIRYFLYEYEKYLQGSLDTKVEWETFVKNQTDKVTIEHVFPQTHTDQYWTTHFKDGVLLHSLGNLLLLSRSKNSALQNDPFYKKKKTLRDESDKVVYNGYDSGSYSELAVCKNADWTPAEIEDRGRKMLDFLKKHWGIDYDFTEDDIKVLLNISGVESPQLEENSLEAESLLEGEENNDHEEFVD